MTSDYLKYFIEVCRCGSIQSASKRLYVSAQGVGQALQRLEKSVGVKLLERTQSGVKPTEFGKIFYEQACAVDRELMRLDEIVEEYKNQNRTRIVIGTLGETKFRGSVETCIANYSIEHPEQMIDVQVRVFHDAYELIDGVRAGQVDIGWMFHWREHEDLKYYHINDYSRLMLLMSADNALAKMEKIEWSDLETLRFVTAGEGDPFSNLVTKQCRDNGFTPNNVFYTTENNLIASLVDNDVAAIVLRESYHSVIKQFCKNAVALPVTPEVLIASSLFVSRDRKYNNAVMQFREYMVHYLRDVLRLGGVTERK